MITLFKVPPEAKSISNRNKTIFVSFLGDEVNVKVLEDLRQDMSTFRPSLVFSLDIVTVIIYDLLNLCNYILMSQYGFTLFFYFKCIDFSVVA